MSDVFASLRSASAPPRASVTRARLVPLKFQTNQVRRLYRMRKATPTWGEWTHVHAYALVAAGGAAMLVLILYLKWCDRRRKKALMEEATSHT